MTKDKWERYSTAHWGINSNEYWDNWDGVADHLFYDPAKLPVTESVNALAMPYERVMPLIKRAIFEKLTSSADWWMNAARRVTHEVE